MEISKNKPEIQLEHVRRWLADNAFDETDLDDLVHDFAQKCGIDKLNSIVGGDDQDAHISLQEKAASEINNGGVYRQLTFLVDGYKTGYAGLAEDLATRLGEDELILPVEPEGAFVERAKKVAQEAGYTVYNDPQEDDGSPGWFFNDGRGDGTSENEYPTEPDAWCAAYVDNLPYALDKLYEETAKIYCWAVLPTVPGVQQGFKYAGERISETTYGTEGQAWRAACIENALPVNFQLDDFTLSYIGATLWSTRGRMDEDDEGSEDNLDANFDRFDLSIESMEAIILDCAQFQADNAMDLTIAYGLYTPSGEWTVEDQSGHDYSLTRNNHGAGFWDRGIGTVGERLTVAAHLCGGCDIEIGSDKKLHWLGASMRHQSGMTP